MGDRRRAFPAERLLLLQARLEASGVTVLDCDDERLALRVPEDQRKEAALQVLFGRWEIDGVVSGAGEAGDGSTWLLLRWVG